MYDGLEQDSVELMNICNRLVNSIMLKSSSNSLRVNFESDSSFSGKGFIANYEVVPARCGGTLRAPMGSFSSPNYPKNYDKNETCEWLIQVLENHVVSLEFTDVNLLQSPNKCKTNYIKVCFITSKSKYI